MNIGLKFSKKNILFLILHVCVCQIMEVHSMLRFSELQCLTGLSCRLNGIFIFRTIFPVFPIVWLYKGKIVGRKGQVKINEQEMQKR